MTFLEQSVSENFSAALEKVEASNPDVLAMRWMLGADLYYEWAQSIGVSMHSKLRDASSPIPPVSLRLITAAVEEEVFLWSGAKDISIFMSLFYEHWKQGTGEPARVFDFGCGCGRMSRFLNTAQNVVPFASDINANHVAWCASNLDRVRRRSMERPRRCPSMMALLILPIRSRYSLTSTSLQPLHGSKIFREF